MGTKAKNRIVKMEQPVEGASCALCGKRSEKYNGWPNYETWNVALWIGNDSGSQEYWDERARECLKDAKPKYSSQTKEESATCDLAEMLKAEIKDGEQCPDLGASMYADLLGAALSSVDWYCIAEHYISEVGE